VTQAPALGAAEPTATPTDVTDNDPTRLTPYLRTILAVVLVADILDLMDSTITTIAAPSIADHLGGGESLIKWLGPATPWPSASCSSSGVAWVTATEGDGSSSSGSLGSRGRRPCAACPSIRA
jgi:hypothetical protein